MKKIIYLEFFDLFWYKLDLFWSNSNFLIMFVADLINFIVTYFGFQELRSKKSIKSRFNHDLSQNLALGRFGACLIWQHWCQTTTVERSSSTSGGQIHKKSKFSYIPFNLWMSNLEVECIKKISAATYPSSYGFNLLILDLTPL